MAARGTESKEIITNKILSTFEGAFRYDKEIRIPIMENGELVQIKVTLTAAKTNVECGEIVVEMPENVTTNSAWNESEPTEAEKEELRKKIASLF